MTVYEKLIEFSKLTQSKEAPSQYRDPQEFISLEERDESSDIYSFGMLLFKILSEHDYFDYIGIPADEYFMTIDFSLLGSVIEKKHIPDEYSDFSELLEGMTSYERETRISYNEVLKTIEELKQKYGPETPEKETDDNPTKTEENKTDVKFWLIESGYDYGIILNNKRIGRIEFCKLFDGTIQSTEEFIIPVDQENIFKIAVSKRHVSNKNISNPSSVYGDSILPVGILEADVGQSSKIKILFETQNGCMNVKISALDLNNEELYEITEQQIRFTKV